MSASICTPGIQDEAQTELLLGKPPREEAKTCRATSTGESEAQHLDIVGLFTPFKSAGQFLCMASVIDQRGSGETDSKLKVTSASLALLAAIIFSPSESTRLCRAVNDVNA